ncbi:UNVERIFIED_CONTAM: hypothetical protein K2H54_057622 [Gekko kuhli]
MAPGKDKGQAKVKHLAPMRHNLEPVRPESSYEEDNHIKAAILACLDALEKQRGKHALPPIALEGTKKGKPKTPAFQAKILVCLAIMEEDGTSGDQQGSDESPKPELLAIRFLNAENAQKFKAKFEECRNEVDKKLKKAGADKNDSADKVAEKLEELSVKDESKEPEKKEVKEETEEKQ